MNAPLRDKSYFDQRASSDMAKHLPRQSRTTQETMAYACRILAMTEQEAGLAGQISVRSERPGAYWTLRFGLGFDEATPADFIEVDRDLNALSGGGMANPATRFHLWVYDARPDVNAIIHTHSPWASALAAARQPLVIAQMDMTPLHNDCAFLGDWPGVPIADQEGVIISEALGDKRAIILAHHGYLTAGKTCEEATYLSVYLERAARMQIRAQAFGPLTPVDDELAREAHDYLLKPSIVNSTFAYWARQTHGIAPYVKP
ncbi:MULTISPECIES: aldolase [Cupriavidus]|uniref:aldolase n=1 Tax=Cupriavidus TaxID=106589 RepID=UPI000E12198A|nr:MULTISPECIES: aldolase [Cupriavidus]MEC3766181.1 aldolase [Cupriavidus sp. SS-3]SOY97437.1 Class II aldolase/adducin domain protein [Cupriavidus taiwanensis]SOZ00166.1 Class II aldolase/adducin domain protein [Cupriavidus taiwanensis]